MFNSNIFQIILAFLAVAGLGHCKLREYTFKVSYISGRPDGVWTNSILGINGKFPCPAIEAETGDTLQITVINEIQDGQNVTLHWHGILQRGTPFEDGPSEITQCPIKSGKSQIYTFPVPQAGTYWYHSHVNSQYTEGLWGLLIVRSPQEVYKNKYDDELVITLNDWYHTSAHENEEFLLSPSSGGAPPFPFSGLMNGVGRYPCVYALLQNRVCLPRWQQRPVFKVQPGKTYRLRLINTSGWTAFNFTIDGYQLRTIEVDGVDTQLSEQHQAVHIAAGQRYSFLLTIPRSARLGKRALIRASMRTEFLFTRPNNINKYPEALIKEVTGVLLYSLFSSSAESVQATTEHFDYMNVNAATANPSKSWANLKFLNELDLIPYDKLRAPLGFDKNVNLDIGFMDDAHGTRRGAFNGRPFHMPMDMPQLAMLIHNKTMPESLNPVYISYGQIIQVVVNNPELGPHPVHLHGHHFWVMGMGKEGEGNYDSTKHQLSYNGYRRDTVLVKENSWLVIRFRADNVGVWTLHCHVDWHMLTGMIMTFVEAPELAHTISIPSEAKRVCADHNILI